MCLFTERMCQVLDKIFPKIPKPQNTIRDISFQIKIIYISFRLWGHLIIAWLKVEARFWQIEIFILILTSIVSSLLKIIADLKIQSSNFILLYWFEHCSLVNMCHVVYFYGLESFHILPDSETAFKTSLSVISLLVLLPFRPRFQRSMN